MRGVCDGCGADDLLLPMGLSFLCADCIYGEPEDFEDEWDDPFDDPEDLVEEDL